MSKIVLAIDVMGADRPPREMIKGCEKARRKIGGGLFFELHGDAQVIENVLRKYPKLHAISTVVHAQKAVLPTDDMDAFRRKRKETSMFAALGAVKDGRAHGVVSAGNTAALVMFANNQLNRLVETIRPVLASETPRSGSRRTLILDQGALVDATAEQLASVGVIGATAARVLFGLKEAELRLLTNGTEPWKGNKLVRETAKILSERASPGLVFDPQHPYIEGDDVFQSVTDVVLTDGHMGNGWLKGSEGSGRYIKDEAIALAKALPPLGMISALFATPYIFWLKRRIDRKYNKGAIVLGVDGLVIKSHGAVRADGFAQAIELGHRFAEAGLIGQLRASMTG